MVHGNYISFGRTLCSCEKQAHAPRLVVITGGPGAGKTALLDLAKQIFCTHVVMVPESASLIFSGGFWRVPTNTGKKAAQRAIFHVQSQLENILVTDQLAAIGLCDRGTVDGVAYWPEGTTSYWEELNTTREKEFARYEAVIHLRTPSVKMGYNNISNPLRTEDAETAAKIDEKIFSAWQGHPHHFVINSTASFIEKQMKAIEILSEFIPKCCRQATLRKAI